MRTSRTHRGASSRQRLCCLLGLLALLIGTGANAQPPAPQGPPPGPPPIGMLLGIADFMIVIDRPFEAEKIYRTILHFAPDNPAAKKGLEDAKRAERPTYTVLAHRYYDSHDVDLFAWGGGPTFRTPYGRITFTVGDGYYKNNNLGSNVKNPLGPVASGVDDFGLRKQTINLLLEPYYRKFEGYFFLSQVLYDGAPDRFLYDLKASYVPQPGREKYTATFARRDTFLQSDKNEFFAPESYWGVASGLTLDETSFSIDYPVQDRLDLNGYYGNFDYSDGNNRSIYRTQLMYRLLPRANRPMPVFRIGLAHAYDDTRQFAAYYYSPQKVQSLALAVDYVNLGRRLKYGVFGTYPFVKGGGNGFATHDPARTLFGFVNYNVSSSVELYLKFGSINSPRYDLSFTDVVFGINGRF